MRNIWAHIEISDSWVQTMPIVTDLFWNSPFLGVEIPKSGRHTVNKNKANYVSRFQSQHDIMWKHVFLILYFASCNKCHQNQYCHKDEMLYERGWQSVYNGHWLKMRFRLSAVISRKQLSSIFLMSLRTWVVQWVAFSIFYSQQKTKNKRVIGIEMIRILHKNAANICENYVLIIKSNTCSNSP